MQPKIAECVYNKMYLCFLQSPCSDLFYLKHDAKESTLGVYKLLQNKQ